MYTNLLFFIKGKSAGKIIEIAKAVRDILYKNQFQGRFDFIPVDSAVTLEIDWDGKDSFRPDSIPAMWIVGTGELGWTDDQLADFRHDIAEKVKMDVVLI